jgi:hypothetical protein
MDNEVNKTIQFERLQCLYYWWEWFMKHALEMASDGMIYIPSFMKIGSGHACNIKVIISTIWEAAVLVLLMGRIYDVCHWDNLRWHGIYTKFHADLFRNWSNI